MDLFSFPPLAAVLQGAYGALMWLADTLTPVAGAASAALAIVLVTLLVRAALIPVGVSQAKAEQTRARLAPRLRALQERHRRDPERLQRETMKLYQDENASPWAGCLPLLAQAPVVGVIYALFLHTSIAGHANALLTQSLWGAPLGTSLFGALTAGTLSAAVVPAVVVVLIAAVGELTRRLVRPPASPDSPVAARMAGVAGVLQFVTAGIAVFVPLAAGLYLFVTVTWTLGQRVVLRRRYPLP